MGDDATWSKVMKVFEKITEVEEKDVIAVLESIIDQIDRFEFDLNRPLDDENAHTLLDIASFHMKEEVTTWLLLRGADPTSRNSKGESPLHHVAQHITGDTAELAYKMLTLLSVAGGDLYLPAADGSTPESIAKTHDFDLHDQDPAPLEPKLLTQLKIGRNRREQLEKKMGRDVKQLTPAYPDAKAGPVPEKFVKEAEKKENAPAAADGADDKQKKMYKVWFNELKELYGKSQVDQPRVLQLLELNRVAKGKDPATAFDWNKPLDKSSKANLLGESVRLGAFDVISVLVNQEGIDVNRSDVTGSTALHVATATYQTETAPAKRIIDALLVAGADRALTNFSHGKPAADLLPNGPWKQWLVSWKPPDPAKIAAEQAALGGRRNSITSPTGADKKKTIEEQNLDASAALGDAAKTKKEAAEKKAKAEEEAKAAKAKEKEDRKREKGEQKAANAREREEKRAARAKRGDVKMHTIVDDTADMQQLYDALRMSFGDGSGVEAETVAEQHRLMHGCDCSDKLVKDIIKQQKDKSVTRDNLGTILKITDHACRVTSSVTWDFHALDSAEYGRLSLANAGVLWSMDNHDSGITDAKGGQIAEKQPSLKKFMKKRPAELPSTSLQLHDVRKGLVPLS